MTPYWSSGVSTLYQADARLLPLEDRSVHTVITSPPYWRTRRYRGVGEAGIGEEPTAALYLEHLLEVFAEVWRVLRNDGILWLNIGDSRVTNPGNGRGGGERLDGGLPHYSASDKSSAGQALNLLGIPWRLAFALHDQGWILRSDIIWAKPNSMPESISSWHWEKHERRRWSLEIKYPELRRDKQSGSHVWEPQVETCQGCPKCIPNDGLVLRRGAWRPTHAHEYIFMLTKTAKYFADGEAVGNGWHVGANRRSVWTDISPEVHHWKPGHAHYATFPEDLPRICIQASTSEAGVCARCGSQWARVVERTPPGRIRGGRYATEMYGHEPLSRIRENGWCETVGWRPTCRCANSETLPAVVLDPFCGSGTTLVAAQRLGRRAVGVDLSAEYLRLAVERIQAMALPLRS